MAPPLPHTSPGQSIAVGDEEVGWHGLSRVRTVGIVAIRGFCVSTRDSRVFLTKTRNGKIAVYKSIDALNWPGKF